MDLRDVPAAMFLVIALAYGTSPAEASRACDNARKKIDREARTIAGAADAIARERLARESCTTRSQCARYDGDIADNERTKSRHESRLARFRDEAAQVCGAG